MEKTLAEYLQPYFAICALLEKNGFERQCNGDMIRQSTGCSFPVDCLQAYKSVVDFQLDWPYA